MVTPQSLVTVDNVRAALTADKGANAHLTAWKVVDFTKKGDNFAFVVSSVEVKYELDGKKLEVVYVVKLNSYRKCPYSEAITDVCFEKEANMYSTLIPQLNSVLKEIGQKTVRFPKCFYACVDKEKQIIYLEDLRPLGYKMLDRRCGLNEVHATYALKEIAKLHAASLLLQNTCSEEDFIEKYLYLKNDWVELFKNSEAVVKLIRDGIIFAQEVLKTIGGYKKAIAWMDTIIPKIADVFYEQMRCGEPKVVCHGDYWNNNLLFRYDEDGHLNDMMVIDLQNATYSTPAIDLNYFIYTSTTKDVRKSNLQAFLDCYYDTLTDTMEAAGQEAPFTREQLRQNFRDKNLFGLIFGIMFAPATSFSNDEVASSEDSEMGINELLGKAREYVMSTLDTNPTIKLKFMSLFDDMMEVGLIQ